eukprot:6192658-Pleurochrysis_carterae.AAC.1
MSGGTGSAAHVLSEPAGRAIADLATALRVAGRARDTVAALSTSVQPSPVDFKSLDLDGWKRQASRTLFKGKDGAIRFTDGRAVVRRSATDDGAIEIQVRTTEPGRAQFLSTQELLAMSVAALPGVLS